MRERGNTQAPHASTSRYCATRPYHCDADMPYLGLLVTCQATDNRTASNGLLNNTSLVATLATRLVWRRNSRLWPITRIGRIQIPICNRMLMHLDTYSRIIQLIRTQVKRMIRFKAYMQADILLFREMQKNAKDSTFKNGSENLSSSKENISIISI